MEQKIYLVITEYRGGDDDELHKDILGLFFNKEKAIKRVWQDFDNLQEDSFLQSYYEDDIHLEKSDDSFSYELGPDGEEFIDTYIKEMEIE